MGDSKDNISWKDYILDSIDRGIALKGISPSVRAINIEWDEHSIDMYFIYDGAISDDDVEASEWIATEVLASFYDEDVRTHHERCDFPEPSAQLGRECAYRKKEPSIFKHPEPENLLKKHAGTGMSCGKRE